MITRSTLLAKKLQDIYSSLMALHLTMEECLDLLKNTEGYSQSIPLPSCYLDSYIELKRQISHVFHSQSHKRVKHRQLSIYVSNTAYAG